MCLYIREHKRQNPVFGPSATSLQTTTNSQSYLMSVSSFSCCSAQRAPFDLHALCPDHVDRNHVVDSVMGREAGCLACECMSPMERLEWASAATKISLDVLLSRFPVDYDEEEEGSGAANESSDSPFLLSTPHPPPAAASTSRGIAPLCPTIVAGSSDPPRASVVAASASAPALASALASDSGPPPSAPPALLSLRPALPWLFPCPSCALCGSVTRGLTRRPKTSCWRRPYPASPSSASPPTSPCRN